MSKSWLGDRIRDIYQKINKSSSWRKLNELESSKILLNEVLNGKEELLSFNTLTNILLELEDVHYTSKDVDYLLHIK